MLIPTDPQISETLECIANKVRLVNSVHIYIVIFSIKGIILTFGESTNRQELFLFKGHFL